MGIDMKAFMKPELKDRGTMEFPGIERYKDAEGNKIPFIIKRLSMKKIKEIRNNHKTKEVISGQKKMVTAQLLEVTDRLQLSMITMEILQVLKLWWKHLYSRNWTILTDGVLRVYDRLDMPNIIFPDKDDFKYADDCLMEACGLTSKKDDKETVEELKNDVRGG